MRTDKDGIELASILDVVRKWFPDERLHPVVLYFYGLRVDAKTAMLVCNGPAGQVMRPPERMIRGRQSLYEKQLTITDILLREMREGKYGRAISFLESDLESGTWRERILPEPELVNAVISDSNYFRALPAEEELRTYLDVLKTMR